MTRAAACVLASAGDATPRRRPPRRWSRALPAAVCLLGMAVLWRPAASQTDPHALDFSQVRLDAEADHLARVGAWGSMSLVGGTLAVLMAPSSELRAYGAQSAIWGATNLVVAGLALARRGGDPPETLAAEQAAEARLHRVLRTNLVVSAGAVAAGAVLFATAPRGTPGDAQRGHGASIVTQGAALLTLDGVAYVASRRRQTALAGAVAVRSSGTSLSVVVSW